MRGSQSASSGKAITSTITTNIENSIQPTHCTVSSMRTLAMRHETMRLTASGGVNWPSATFSVRITPNHTGSHL
ncbi:hypothetical protein D3C78_1961150 [compost metagenome]